MAAINPDRRIRLGGAEDRRGLPGQRGVDHLQAVGLHEARVGHHLIARFEEQDVAGHNLPGRDKRFRAVPQDPGLEFDQSLQSLHGLVGPPFLGKTEEGIDKDYGDDGPAELGHTPDKGKTAGHPQNDGQHMHEIAHQKLNPGVRNTPGDFVEAVLLQPSPGFFAVETPRSCFQKRVNILRGGGRYVCHAPFLRHQNRFLW